MVNKTYFYLNVSLIMIQRTLFSSLLMILCGFSSLIFGQKPVIIKLDNPSFEDFPQAGHTPQGWFDCGFAGETPPDVQPNNAFSVNKPAFNGSTYVGLVTRDNNTWEALGQRLKTPLLKGVTYTFSIYLSRSELYMSESRLTHKATNYITPITVRLWGGSGYCTKEDNLAETEPVSSGTWQKFSFKFTPKATHSYLTVEAFYKIPTLFPYNGNILIDNASDIVPEEKPKPPIVAIVVPPKRTPKPPTPPKTVIKKPDTPPVIVYTEPKKPEPKVIIKPEPTKIEELPTNEPDKIREGLIIKMEKVQFEMGSSKIDETSISSLDEVYNFLTNNINLIVEVGGHTNLVISDDASSLRLSTERARAVRDYLIQKGIDKKRIIAKGYGKTQPIENATTQAANKINQRVEIKILSING